MGVDVRSSDGNMQTTEGFFVVPIDTFIGTTCFSSYQVAHYRDGDGYGDKWYDRNDASALDGVTSTYTYTTQSDVTSDIYFTAATYLSQIIPNSCTTGTLSNGQSASYPAVQIAVYKSTTSLGSAFYFDQFHRPIQVASSQH